MIFIVSVSFLWGSFLSFFILKPLVKINRKIIILFSGSFIILFSFLYGFKVFAQEVNVASVPSVNQFTLVPSQGFVHVYYVGVFSNTEEKKEAKILLPFPKNTSNIIIHSAKNSSYKIENNEVILNTPLVLGTNQIQGEFNLNAMYGEILWQKNSLSFLPGVVIFIMSEKPAKFIYFPKDFRSIPGDNTQYVRLGNSSSLFPEFKITNIIPSRSLIHFLIIFFACCFVAALIVSVRKLKS